MDVQELIDSFNNGEFEDYLKHFGDYETFFKFLDKRRLLGDLDPTDDGSGDWANSLMLYFAKSYPEKYREYLLQMLNDIEFIDGVPYIICDKEDLAILFCTRGRNDLDRKTIESVLRGDGDFFDLYWDTTNNVYEDVIEELTPENLKSLAEYIVGELNGEKLSPDTEELEIIAVSQDHPGYVVVTNDNIMRILKDEETMTELLEDRLSDLRNTLYSIHSNAYNSAYESMIYKNINGELETFFDMDKSNWSQIPHPFKKDTFIEKWKAPINNFDSNIIEYLENNKNYGSSSTLEYHGSYLGVLNDLTDDRGECLNSNIDDYPDFREVEKNINMYFKDEF
jgi:hypothetical protein